MSIAGVAKIQNFAIIFMYILQQNWDSPHQAPFLYYLFFWGSSKEPPLKHLFESLLSKPDFVSSVSFLITFLKCSSLVLSFFNSNLESEIVQKEEPKNENIAEITKTT